MPGVHVLLLLLASFVFVGCQKSLEQYDKDSGPKVGRTAEAPKFQKPTEPTNPDGGKDIDLVDDRDLTPEEANRITRENSLKPITYGVGAGGITLDTELKEGKKILAPPRFGPNSDGEALYPEGLFVDWRMDSPKVPELIIVTGDYQGPLSLPAPYGDFRMNQSFAAHLRDDPSGEKLVKDLFVKLEGTAADYDCLAVNRCQIARNPDYFALVFPKMLLFLTNDSRFVMFRVGLMHDFSPGKLASDFDFLKGEFLLEDQNGQLTGEKLGLGLTWGELKEKSAADSHTEVLTSAFVKRVQGVGIGLSKSKFDRDYKEPTDSEVFEVVSVFGEYDNKVLIDGKLVVVEFAPLGLSAKLTLVEDKRAPVKGVDKVVEKVADAPETPAEAAAESEEASGQEEDETLYLATKLPFGGNFDAGKSLILALGDLMMAEVRKAQGFTDQKDNPKVLLFKKTYGLNESGPDRSFTVDVGFFNLETQKGRNYRATVSVGSGSLGFTVEDINDPFAGRVVPADSMPIVAGRDEIGSGGYKLGELVTVKDIDEARDEATMFKKDREARVGYITEGAVAVAYRDSAGRTAEVIQSQEVIFGPMSLRLGVHLVQQGRDQSGNLIKLMQINSITTTSNKSVVVGLCGIPGFQAKFGTRDTEFEKNLQKAVVNANARREEVVAKVKANVDAGKPPGEGLTREEVAYFQFRGCKYFKPVDQNHTGRTSAIYFPDQRVKLFMVGRELSGVTVYKKIDELLNELNKEKAAVEAAAAAETAKKAAVAAASEAKAAAKAASDDQEGAE